MPSDHSQAIDPQAAAKKKKQLSIVVLLLAGLLIAIVTQPSSENDEASATIVKPVALKSVDSKSPPEKDGLREELTQTQELSRLETDSVLQTSLFDVPEPEPEPELDEAAPEQAVTEVRVQAIYGTGKLTENPESTGHRVLIGRAIIRPGEVLPDGRQIIRVTPDGVELAQ